jgi:hypothetical protein
VAQGVTGFSGIVDLFGAHLKMSCCTINYFAFALIALLGLAGGAYAETPQDVQAGIDFLKSIEGKWIGNTEKAGTFDWVFDVTSRGNVIVERMKIGTPTAMTSTYYIADGKLHATHFCQLQNQPHMTKVDSETEGDLHFLCTGNVGNTKSHDELHLHGVHFQKNGDKMTILMDMFKDGKVASQVTYELVRSDAAESTGGSDR